MYARVGRSIALQAIESEMAAAVAEAEGKVNAAEEKTSAAELKAEKHFSALQAIESEMAAKVQLVDDLKWQKADIDAQLQNNR